MKKLIMLFLVVSALSTDLRAQSQDEKDVAAAVETLRKAMVDGDKNALETVLAAELSYGHSSGKVENKAAFVESLVSGKSDFASINLFDQTILIVNNAAIVRHKLSGESMDSGKASPVNLYILLVWQKQNGKWKLIARHAARIVS